MGRIYKTYLEGNCLYTCSQCSTHLSLQDHLISTSFHGRTGRAYLFDKVVNLTYGPLEERIFTTGLHSVNDIYCISCNSHVGWYYKEAYEESQKYKEGKFIVEKALMRKTQIKAS
mmetsp:Transcript_14116/g.16886  ORF Transcript_14116/g.16886 Transcript_14116/m.16886 type:complete len:115 (-) Transcript_14116:199-543(-)|eukprot:jgi/Bigna1/48627/estExt_Genewise1.C_290100